MKARKVRTHTACTTFGGVVTTGMAISQLTQKVMNMQGSPTQVNLS